LAAKKSDNYDLFEVEKRVANKLHINGLKALEVFSNISSKN